MIDFGLLKGMGPQAYWEMSETNWTMKRGSHNGRVGWAEWSWICWWVKGAAAPRQPANKRDKPAQSARLFFPFSSMKSIELWNWFHWIAELEWIGLWVMFASSSLSWLWNGIDEFMNQWNESINGEEEQTERGPKQSAVREQTTPIPSPRLGVESQRRMELGLLFFSLTFFN